MIQGKVSIGLTAVDWKEIGAYANKLIQNDMAEGKFQNNRSGLQYKSQQYKKYKANGMRRLTKGGVAKDFDPSHDYNGKRLYGKKKKTDKGKRVSGFYGLSVESTNTAFVDMTLTGRLKKSLKVKSATNSSVTSGYDPGDNNPGKILGNRRFGREVLGLSDENIKKVKDFIQELLSAKLKSIMPQQINIEVTF